LAVVRNLMIRIGADYSAAQKGMQGAKKSLDKFRNDADRATKLISGSKGLGGVGNALGNLGRDVAKTTTSIKGNKGLKGISSSFVQTGQVVSDSISRIRGANGIGGVVSELGNLKSASVSASSDLTALGGRATSVGSRIAFLVGSLAAAVTVIGLLIKGLHAASQPAVQFESTINRLNMSLRNGSSDYLAWAKSMGIAKTAAAEMGATYGMLLSSFIKDNNDLTQNTKNLVQASRVVASATGRTIDDVMERMRSGLLGNTEAIEDLGVFVNVSMIESTQAFKKFAEGKSWDKLSFQVQQQIRLAAILEQTYARYGNQLQNNVMNKQSSLMDQLANIKLHLSQSFMPIWDAVLPALTKMAEGVSWLTEQLARFSYWVRGWDYDEQTTGINNQTGAVTEQADAYDDLAKDAKKARKELASFDRLNLLGNSSGSGAGGKTGTGGSWSNPSAPSPNNNNEVQLPNIPPPPTIRGKLVFDPPVPPDAGAGAVATAVNATVNTLNVAIKLRMEDMWSNLQGQVVTGLVNQRIAWEGYSNALTSVIIPKLVSNVSINWGKMLDGMQTKFVPIRLALQTGWTSMMDLLKNKLVTEGTSILTNWGNVLVNVQTKLALESPKIQTQWQTMLQGFKNALITDGLSINKNWSNVLSNMVTDLTNAKINLGINWDAIKSQINSVKEPLAQLKSKFATETAGSVASVITLSVIVASQFGLMKEYINDLKSPLDTMKESFKSTLSSMGDQVDKYLTPIIVAINATKTAWNQLKSAFTGKTEKEQSSGVNGEAVAAGAIAASGVAIAANWSKMLESLKTLGKSLSSSAGSIFGPIDAIMGNIYDKMSEEMGWSESTIPAFAKGGVVNSPTLAMVGDNHNARSNPEIIAPQDMMYATVQAAMGGSNTKIISLLERVARATENGKNVTVQVSESEVGSAAANHINREYRRGVNVLESIT
jgi:hypothetical protein